MTKRPDTSETAIALAFLVMNLDTLLHQLASALLSVLMRLADSRFTRPLSTLIKE